MNISEGPAMYQLLMKGGDATVGDLCRHPADRDRYLACVPLYLKREEREIVLPPEDFELRPGDVILFAGRGVVRSQQQAVLRNEKVRDYVVTGNDKTGGWIWQWLIGAGRSAERKARM